MRLTPRGKNLWRDATAARIQTERELFDVLGDAELGEVNRLLAAVLYAAEQRYGSAPRHDQVR